MSIEVGAPLEDLLKKHEGDIAEVMKATQAEIDDFKGTTVFDDITILRFLVASNGDKGAAIENVKKSIAWRTKNAALLDSLALKEDGSGWIPTGDDGQNKDFAFLASNICSALIGDAGKHNVPVQVVRTAFTNQKGCMKETSEDNIILFQTLQSEGFYRICDERTRESKTLVMACQIVDLKGFGLMGKKTDKAFFGMNAKSGEVSAFLHPCLFGARFSVNASRTLGMLKGMFGKKEAVVSYGSNKKLAADAFIKANDVLAILPDFLGGKGKTPEFFGNFKK